ncbi:MAG: hypothetical protein ACH37Z_11470 [Anaerolineae bacterium]
MPLPLGITGLREITPFRLAPDAGMCFGNINVEDLLATGLADAVDPANTWLAPNDTTVIPRALGATQGGTMVDPKVTRSRVPIDDVRVPLMGLDRTDDTEPTMQLNLVEVVDLDTIKMSQGPIDEEAPSVSGYIALRPSLVILMEHYMGNVAIATSTTIEGEERPLIILLENPIALQPAQWKTNPKGIITLQTTLRGSQPVSQATVVPIRFFVPESAAA